MENRNSNFDIVRAVAIFMVICIHSLGLVNDALPTGDEEARMTNAVMTIVYGGVPLFVMLSGALLLGKDEPIGVFFRKRMGRVLWPFLFWSVIVCAILYWQEGGRSLFGYATSLFNQHHHGQQIFFRCGTFLKVEQRKCGNACIFRNWLCNCGVFQNV